MQFRSRRSVLYMPAANSRALEKARTLAADAIIVDLEDAIAPHMKEAARETCRQALTQGGYGHREVVLRVNPLASAWGREDIRFAATLPLDGVLLSKVNSPQDVLDGIAALDQAGASPDLPVWAMAETPRALLDIDLICGAHPRLKCLVLGTNDLVFEMRARLLPGREAVVPALVRAVLAARAHNVDVLDGVHMLLDDKEGFRAECQQGRAIGFDGKTLIHPNQIDIANEVFGATPAEIEHARKVIAAWDAAVAEGKGVAVVDGRFIENLHMFEARRILAQHEAMLARDI